MQSIVNVGFAQNIFSNFIYNTIDYCLKYDNVLFWVENRYQTVKHEYITVQDNNLWIKLCVRLWKLFFPRTASVYTHTTSRLPHGELCLLEPLHKTVWII